MLRTVACGLLVSFAVVGCSSADPESQGPSPISTADTTQPEGPGDGTTVGDPTIPGADASADPSGDASVEGGASCVSDASAPPFRCSADGMSRSKCVSGARVVEPCARGCLRESGSDDVCMGTSTTWSCPGSYGTTKASNGDYDLTAFGCWVDASGVAHGDSGDNCIPSCLAKAKAAGVCQPGDTGKQCEERVTWYTADAARFGCLARLRITNPANGKSVIALALDYGPSCSVVEARVSKAVLDASGRVDRALFGSDMGVSDRAAVHVVEVDSSTPLGPTP